jgi:hypothetical protein
VPTSASKIFEIATFVTDETMYEDMRGSFVSAGFPEGGFMRLSDRDSDPFTVISQMCRSVDARYVILCHQDIRVDQGRRAPELLSTLEQLDAIDPAWTVAGNAGAMRTGRILRRLIDPLGGPTGEPLPLPVVSLDENFLVLNVRNEPRCTPGLTSFHLYGTDVCLNALRDGGAAYVIDFPVTHLSDGKGHADYGVALRMFIESWNRRSVFAYVLTPQRVIFLSRFGVLRRVFGSDRVLAWVDQHRRPYVDFRK